jgi:hypothetical protein
MGERERGGVRYGPESTRPGVRAIRWVTGTAMATGGQQGNSTRVRFGWQTNSLS